MTLEQDSEFWGPVGLGCSRCHQRPPLIYGISVGPLCEECLLSCFAGWTFDTLVSWLGVQRGTYVRQEKRLSAWRAWRRRDGRQLDAYEREYGVKLVA